VHTDIIIPDTLFSNPEKTKEGDTGTGILDVFDRYNFTVKENEPLEKEVAIDPELLGKSYEKFNAIRPDNFEEYKKALRSGKKGDESKFNKQFGVYYTPREIVHYMCQQSLINYLSACLAQAGLATELSSVIPSDLPAEALAQAGARNLKEDIETLIHLGEQVHENEARVISEGRETKTYSHKLPKSIRKNAKLIDEKLADITVCDPAVGSGAFPVGMMSEIVKTRNVLTPFLSLQGAQATCLRAGTHRQAKQSQFDDNRTVYNFKRRCIEHSLYGVDIDPGAVEIAKLRLWLSLVVDEVSIKNIKPLPNLDYKIVCGNSLLGVEKDLFNYQLFNELEKLKPQFFNETNPTKKQDYKKRIGELISQITNEHTEFDFEVYFSEVFHKKGGFDVVIANPPYIQLQKDSGSLATLYKNCGFKTFKRTGDIYALFYEMGCNVLKESGHLTFISSNKWMRAGYGAALRKFFTEKNPVKLLDFGGFKIFESATVDTNIIVVENCENGNRLEATHFKNDYKKGESVHHYFNENKVILGNLTADTWFIGNKAEVALKEKIETIGTPLKDWDVKINFGIKTGCNEAFIINEAKRAELIAKDQKSAEIIKPILRGRDIKRYGYEFAGLYLIDSHNGYLDKNGNRISPIKIDNYPVVKEHLDKNWIKIKKRQDKGVTPYNLRNCAYYPEFAKEKVVWTDITTSPTFSLVPPGVFFNNTVYSISGDHRKYLLAILNSSIVNFIFPLIATDLGEKGNRYFKIFVEKVPIMPITSENRYLSEQIKGFVEQILTAKRTNPEPDTTALEAEIDQLVYKLYGLTPEEIEVVENSNKK